MYVYKELQRKGSTSDKTLKFFSYEYKKATDLEKKLIFFLKYTSVYTTSQEDLSNLIVEHLLKKLQSFLIFISKELCKTKHILKIQLILFSQYWYS